MIKCQMGKWIVCSAWPYINGMPHLGTMLHLITADFYARFLTQMSEDVISISGSDEHGTPIEVAAIKEGITPKELTDKNHLKLLEVLNKYQIHLSNYSRTENPVHVDFVKEFYSNLEQRGYISRKSTVQLYCEHDKIFLPDRFLEGTCPFCGYDKAKGDQCDSCGRLLEPTSLIGPRCALCGSPAIQRTTEHWYFDLPRFSDELKEYISTVKDLDDNVKNTTLKMIEEGLRPRSVTRDNKWGIPAPFKGAEEKTIYVWMEAVLGYISAVKELGGQTLVDDYWKDDQTKTVFFLAKDNIPFHSIIFPALLMASGGGYVLPGRISSTEFLLFNQLKFSKSQHIGIWADDALKLADGEYWRYVLLSMRPEQRDSNFTNDDLKRTVNDDLNDSLGNFIHRSLSFAYNNFYGAVPSGGPATAEDQAFIKLVLEHRASYVDLIYRIRLKDAMKSFMEVAYAGNEYISRNQPWALLKNDRERASTVTYNAVQATAHLYFMMAPVLPGRAKLLARLLNIGTPGLQIAWEQVPSGHRLEAPVPLFSKIETNPS